MAPIDAPADAAYARLRVQLEAAGAPIGGNDMLIAAHALASFSPRASLRHLVRLGGLAALLLLPLAAFLPSVFVLQAGAPVAAAPSKERAQGEKTAKPHKLSPPRQGFSANPFANL